MGEQGLSRLQIINELTRSPHGDLDAYQPVAGEAARVEPEFLAHLIAWNHLRGQVRDSKVALPAITLASREFPRELAGNSLAHIVMLDARNLLRACQFVRKLHAPASADKLVKRTVRRYLRKLENAWPSWERVAVQHRATLKALYVWAHRKPSPMAAQILFERAKPPGTVFEAIALLGQMSPQEAAGTILERKIPFLIALGALGPKAKEPDLALALIRRMSSTELVTNTKMLERLGVKTDPALRAAYEEGLGKVASSKKTTLKATRAAEAIGDETLKAKLQAAQERQMASAKGVEGNWVVLGDKSGSMSEAIEISRLVAATLAKMVRGKVHLVFFDWRPVYIDATGRTYEEILAETKRIEAHGGTSIGAGLLAAVERKAEIDGIAVVSDGGENALPWFADVYQRLERETGKLVPVYFYRTAGDADVFTGGMAGAGIALETFDLRGGVDYYSLPNLVATMRTNRYSLADEIMETPLVSLDKVLGREMEHVGEAAAL